MPEFLKIFIDLFIVLASILGIIIAVQGRDFLAIPTFRLRVMATFIACFMVCGIAVTPYVLLEADLDAPIIWQIVSGLAIIACLALLPLMIKTRRSATVNKELNTITIDSAIGVLVLFPIFFGLNISSYFGTPSATPLGWWCLLVFVIASVSFVRIVFYQPGERGGEQDIETASTQGR